MELQHFEMLKRMLMCDEGVAHQIYTDTVNKQTIAVGRNLTDTKLRDNEIHLMLENDILDCYALINRDYEFFSKLSPARQCALVDMCFMGFGKLKGFRRMWDAIRMSQYDKAAKEMLESKWATQVHDRADRLAYIMENDKVKPEWYNEFKVIN